MSAQCYSALQLGEFFINLLLPSSLLSASLSLSARKLILLYSVHLYPSRSVTNIYLLNLAASDLCFLVLLPLLIVTALRRMWIFGHVMCKVFYTLTSLNWFAGVFTLTAMSADRYLAVCHAVNSRRYRTPIVSRLVCLVIWTIAAVFVSPICLFARTIENQPEVYSCTIEWPIGLIEPSLAERAFILYALTVGFALPVTLITIFYVLVVLRLHSTGHLVGRGGSSAERHPEQRSRGHFLAGQHSGAGIMYSKLLT